MGTKSIKHHTEVIFYYKKLTQVTKFCDLGLQEPLIKTKIYMMQEETKRNTLEDFLPHHSLQDEPSEENKYIQGLKVIHRSRKMNQWIPCLLDKHKNLLLGPQQPHKNWVQMCTSLTPALGVRRYDGLNRNTPKGS